MSNSLVDVKHGADTNSKREIPDLCADRLDYFLRDSFVYGMIDLNKVNQFLSSFTVVDNEIVMRNFNAAKEAADIFMKMSSTMWASHLQSGTYQILADAIKIAMEKGFVN